MFPTEYIMVIALNIFAILAALSENYTFSLDSGTRQEMLLCLSRNSWNCWSLMTNLSASLRAVSPAFSPSISRHWKTWKQEREVQYIHDYTVQTYLFTYFFHFYLPADRINPIDLLCHVFVIVEDVDDGVDFQCHFILLAPAADLEEVVKVALPALSSANQLVGCFIKAVTGDS